MNFSKITLFAAAVLVGASSLAYAENYTIDKSGQSLGDILVSDGENATITVNTAGTITGSFLGESAFSEVTDAQGDLLIGEGGTFTNADVTSGSITINGGNILQYNGGLGSGYYTDSYLIQRGDTNLETVGAAWESMSSFWSEKVFSGKLTLEGEGTTLNLHGQLTQYVEFNITGNGGQVSAGNRGYVGVSEYKLEAGTTLSFAGSNLNLMDSRPNLSAQHPTSGYNPTGKLALNFINNLTADQSAKIVIGNDANSVNRIFLHTDEDKVSTVGILSGNGRFYTGGAGTVVFQGMSALDPGSAKTEDGETDVSGNTWKQGAKLADIIIGNRTVFVGANGTNEDGTVNKTDKDVADGNGVVDNVFKNATAVQIGYNGPNYASGTSATAESWVQKENIGVNSAGITVSYSQNQDQRIQEEADRRIDITVYGKQVFNNFQSLWMERSALLASPEGTQAPTVWEPVRFSWEGGGRSDGRSTSVRVAGGAILTINQDYGRDGWYMGNLYTDQGRLADDVATDIANNGAGLVVKTGKGKFFYDGEFDKDTGRGLTRLRIEEGEWVSDFNAILKTDVVLEDKGVLTIYVDEVTRVEDNFFVQGHSVDAELNFVKQFTLKNDLTDASLERLEAANGDVTQAGEVSYREINGGSNTNLGYVQMTKEQTQFFGKIVINDGLKLMLGSAASTASKNIFSAASGVVLNDNSSLEINGVQLLRNLAGTAQNKVEIGGTGTLVLTNTDENVTFTGTFDGPGNLVKFGENTQRITYGGQSDLRGNVSVLAGILTISQSAADVGPNALILQNSAQAVFENSSRVGILIGTKDTSVNFSGDLTVGGETTEIPESYLTNPGELVYANGSTAEDRNGVFMKLYATTGKDGDIDVFTKMKESTGGQSLFGEAKTVAEWLQAEFTIKNVEEFINSSGAQLSENMKKDLLSLATTIESSSTGVTAYLDVDGNLNVAGWNKIIAASGLEYFRWKYATKDGEKYNETFAKYLTENYDGSLYGFISAFYSDYKFILTQTNADLISADFGVDQDGWLKASSGNITPDYNVFSSVFGLDKDFADKDEFAGTLTGSGNFVKIGTNTLRLTGVNDYTGKTVVEGGTLFVDWNSIQATSGIVVKNGATLEINAVVGDEYLDLNSGQNVKLGEKEYGKLLTKQRARLSGSGTVRKVGAANVDLGDAVLDVADGSEDFTGTFDIREGALKATVDAAVRSEKGNKLAFNIDFSNAATADSAQFDLVFKATSKATAIDFAGEVKTAATDKKGTFVLDAGINNTLNVKSGKFAVNKLNLSSGTLNVAGNSTEWNIGSIALNQNSALVVDLATNVKSAANITSSGKGQLAVSSDKKAAAGKFVRNTLELTGKVNGLTSVTLTGGAGLTLSGTDKETITLTELSTSSDSTLTINKEKTVTLSVAAEEVMTIAGTLKGDGALVFDGALAEGKEFGKLVIGSEDADGATEAFKGTITFNKGTISLVAGAGKTVTYKGLSIESGTVDAERLLTKEGAGIVKILAETQDATNKFSVKGLELQVNAGELSVSGKVFEQGALPETLSIAEGATFRLCDWFDGTTLDLAKVDLSGAGTLALESESSPTVNVSKNIDSKKFSGLIEIGEKVTLKLGENVSEISAFSGKGTVSVAGESLTIRSGTNADGLAKFEGKIEGSALKKIVAVGTGTVVLNSAIDSVTTIDVGSKTEDGGVGVNNSWKGTINVVGKTSRVVISTTTTTSGTTDGSNTPFSGTTKVGADVADLTLARDGTIALGSVVDTFKLQNPDGSAYVLDGSGDTKVSLSNIAGTQLTLTNLSAIGKEVFALHANSGENGGIVFDCAAPTASVSVLAAASSPTYTWSKDITGTGGVTVSGATPLNLSADTLSYTGATTVKTGATLIFGSTKSTAHTSDLIVETGATLVGGVNLVGENSNVKLSGGSTFHFTGEAVKFAGFGDVVTDTIGGSKLKVQLHGAALAQRGVALSLFEAVGKDAVNNITIDKLTIETNTTDGVYFYKDKLNDVYTSGKTVIYIATNDLVATPGLKIHKGVDLSFVDYLSKIATPTAEGELSHDKTLGLYTYDTAGNATGYTAAGYLADAIIRTSNDNLTGLLNNLSPLSYGSMLALPQTGYLSDIAAIAARIEQRRYDNYSSFIWETRNDWEFFAQAQGSFASADEGETDTRTFDTNTYGALAGMDVKLSQTALAGFSVAYDYGEASIHNGGGDIKSHDIRATAFFGKLFADRFFFDTGAQIGFAAYDVNRNTAVGGVDGDTVGWHAGAFASLGGLLQLWNAADEKSGLYLVPIVGLAFSYYGVNSFDESGAVTALNTDSFGAASLRANIGASLVYKFHALDSNMRVNFDFAYARELLDTDAEIDYAMPSLTKGEKYKAKAQAFAEDTFSIGPRFSIDLDRDTSVYCGYRLEVSTDSNVSHSVNLGYRTRF